MLRSPHAQTTPASSDKLHSTHPLLGHVLSAAAAIDAGETERARSMLHTILDTTARDNSPTHRVTRLFATSLHARLMGDRSETGNLYLDQQHPDAMIAAFQTLVQATPIIRFGYVSATTALVTVLGNVPKLHIIDIGLGSGTQWLTFLDTLASHSAAPPQVRLTGIDVPLPGSDPAAQLHAAGAMLQQRAAERGIRFTFEPLATQVEDLDFTTIRREPDEALAINAVFALHHIAAGDGITTPERSRDTILRRLHALQPSMLLLVEPDVEHNALPFLPRVHESLSHYRVVFDALDAEIPAHSTERATIENAFFGREIRNIVVGEGAQRVERHERHSAWLRRMCTHGFRPIDLSGLAQDVNRGLGLGAAYNLGTEMGMLLLKWKSTRLIAASAWRAEGL